MKSPEQLADEEQAYLAELFDQNSSLKRVFKLSQGFFEMLNQEANQFDGWLVIAEKCSVKIFENFAAGIRADYDASKNALIYS